MKQKPFRLTVLVFSIVLMSLLSLTSCGNNSSSNDAANDTMALNSENLARKTTPQPTGAKPAWAPGIDDEMLVVMEKLQSYADKPIETLSADEARKQHTPTDAVVDVMKEHNIPMPTSKVDTLGKDIPVNAGNIHTRIYTPKEGTVPFPVIVYYHGGGWVIADLNVL